MDCGYTLEPPRQGGFNEYPQSMFCEAVLTSTHNLCFGAKIRKIGIPLRIPVLLYIKVGYKGVYVTQTCFSDGFTKLSSNFRKLYWLDAKLHAIIVSELNGTSRLTILKDGFLKRPRAIAVNPLDG